jgi:lipopolysaccharide biosynthesis glycosyltransferase
MGSASTIHVVVASDDAFALPTAVTLRSLVKANPGVELGVTVLHNAMTDDARRRVETSLPAFDGTVSWKDFRASALSRLPAHHLSPATYYRLAIPEVLGHLDRVLYLDSDILVRSSLQPLWAMDMTEVTVGAVRSVNYPSIGTWGALDNWRAFGVSPRLPYFNAGVLLIDVPRWRASSVTERVMDVMNSGLTNGNIVDQQALNVVLAGSWLELPPTWNMQTPLIDDRRGAHLLYDDETIDEARTDPSIVHFLDRPKPWQVDCINPFRSEWRRVAEETAFAPLQLEKASRLESLKWRIKRAGVALVRGE